MPSFNENFLSMEASSDCVNIIPDMLEHFLVSVNDLPHRDTVSDNYNLSQELSLLGTTCDG